MQSNVYKKNASIVFFFVLERVCKMNILLGRDPTKNNHRQKNRMFVLPVQSMIPSFGTEEKKAKVKQSKNQKKIETVFNFN